MAACPSLEFMFGAWPLFPLLLPELDGGRPSNDESDIDVGENAKDERDSEGEQGWDGLDSVDEHDDSDERENTTVGQICGS